MSLLRPLFITSAALLISFPARAEPTHDALTLTYLPSRAAAPLCPSAGFLALEVHIRLGYKLFQPSAPKHLTVKVERAINGWFRATGEIRDDDGKVTFTDHYSEIDCTAALISMAISVTLEFAKPPEDPEPSPSAPLPLATNPPAPLPCPHPPLPSLPQPAIAALPVPDRQRYQAGIASVFSIGVAPSVVGGVAGFFGLLWSGASVAVEGRALFAPLATIEHVSVRDGYSLSFISISGTVCHHRTWGFGCARIEAGQLSVSNSNIDNNPGRMINLGFGFRVGRDWLLTPHLAIRVYGDLLGQPVSGTLRDMPSTPIIWRPPLLSGSVGIGPVFIFSDD
jgi:hypothetical protein